ncbi:hypothetical protein ACFP4H_22385 [Pseudophaeobacter arcticus]|uniref:hypothetical protein n=1 Tax=Pseudophaeobacter arcticus TaxID=385492 RepID=UPI0012B65E4F|nr:hypothetical protein [Pseudophaeobacter arcticus]
MNKSRFAMITSALTIGLISAAPGSATELDMAIEGGNFSVWSTMSECVADAPRSDCVLYVKSACGWQVYAADYVRRDVTRFYESGGSVELNTIKYVSGQRYFDKHFCTLKK